MSTSDTFRLPNIGLELPPLACGGSGSLSRFGIWKGSERVTEAGEFCGFGKPLAGRLSRFAERPFPERSDVPSTDRGALDEHEATAALR